MRPNQVAQALRQIATKIDRSKRPKRELVAADLKRVLIAVGEDPNKPWKAILTNGSGFESDWATGNYQSMESADFLSYLREDVNNMVILEGDILVSIGADGESLYAVKLTQDLLDSGLRPQDFDGPYDDFGELVNQFYS